MLFKSLVTLATVAMAIATPIQHQHHQHQKKDVHVVTETNYVIVTAGSQPTTLAAPVAPTASDVPQVVPTTLATVSTSAASPGAPASSAPAPAASAGAAGAKGVTYSPYSDNGGCKSTSQIASELAQLSGFDIIRLYGVDCNQVEAVLANKAANQKVFAGIFDVANLQSGLDSLISAVKSNGGWGEIDTVSIGNELVNSGQANPSQIAQYVSTSKSVLKNAGYTGPVVSVDTFIAVINNPALCDASDYIAVNAHAFFDGNIAAADSGKWVLQQIQRVSTACGGSKRVFITETGWPSKGDSNGVAVPSKSNQQAAISSIKSVCGNDATLFTAFNDLWKADGPYNAEKYWGILSSQ